MRAAAVLALWFGLVAGAAAAQEPPPPTDARYAWSLGGYVGIFSASSPIGLITDPGSPEIHSNYIAALTGSATLVDFEAVPLSIELEAVVARRFGDDHFFEFGLLPVLRWRAFPWNDWVYTNFRFGPLGLSYTTGASRWERRNARSHERLLNFMVAELTFARPADTSWEGFLRLHHRSDIFGIVGNFDGNGDDFLSIGLRKRF